MSILEKIKKNSTIKDSAILSKSKFFTEKDSVPTEIPMVNVALSGRLDGGLTPGLTMWAGPSKHFKTAFSLLMAKSYMDKYKDAVLLFYDSEFGTPIKYFETFGIDMERVLHTPLTNIEELKFDVMAQLEQIVRGDKIIIVIDSIGNLASKKEVEDALDGKSVADMSRAKQVKSLFRMITPHLSLKDIPMVVVNHTYKEIGLFPKNIISGGTGIYYSANQIFIISKAQEKEGTDLAGFKFTINIEKSRYVKEKAKLPFTVLYESGIQRWSSLMDLAIESGHITKATQGWYNTTDLETGEIIEPKRRGKDIEQDDAFFEALIKDNRFNKFIEKKYKLTMVEEVNAREDDLIESDTE